MLVLPWEAVKMVLCKLFFRMNDGYSYILVSFLASSFHSLALKVKLFKPQIWNILMTSHMPMIEWASKLQMSTGPNVWGYFKGSLEFSNTIAESEILTIVLDLWGYLASQIILSFDWNNTRKPRYKYFEWHQI